MALLKEIIKLSKVPQSTRGAISSTIIKNIEHIENLSLEQIAQLSYSSKSSVVRYAQYLGYKGWNDFLLSLIEQRTYDMEHYSNIDHNLPFEQDDTIKNVLQKLSIVKKESIQDTADKLNPSSLLKATNIISNANRIVIFGLSPNDYLAHVFKRNMLTIGKNIEVANMGEFGIFSTSLKSNDAAILISYSGNSSESETLKFIPILKQNKVPIIGLTSDEENYLRENSTCCLSICDKEDKIKKIGNFSTEESILFILDSLYALYFSSNYQMNYKYKTSILTKIENNKRS